MPSGWGYSFWFEAAPKTMRGVIGAKALMEGVIVAVVHEEFRGMGLSGVSGFMAEWVVSGGCGLSAGGYVGIFNVQWRRYDFKRVDQFTYW